MMNDESTTTANDMPDKIVGPTMNALPHMMIADAVQRQLGWPECTRAHMVVGAIAPDAHRVIPGVGYRAFHFRSRRKLGERRVDFVDTFLSPALMRGNSNEQAFWAGWFSHVIGDEVWRRMMRAELPSVWQGGASGVGMERERVRAEYHAACDRVDRQFSEAPGSVVSELRWLLRSWNPHYDLGPLSPVLLREWIARVTLEAMPPAEPSAPSHEDITHAFVARAMQASQHETLAELNAEIEKAATAVPDFEDGVEMEFV